MKKTSYRIGESANLAAFPHGTKVGDVVRLTEAQAMYERDMGRITLAESEPLKISEEERAALPALDPNASNDPENRTLGEMKSDPGDGVEKTPVVGDTLTVEETAAKPRRAR